MSGPGDDDADFEEWEFRDLCRALLSISAIAEGRDNG